VHTAPFHNPCISSHPPLRVGKAFFMSFNTLKRRYACTRPPPLPAIHRLHFRKFPAMKRPCSSPGAVPLGPCTHGDQMHAFATLRMYSPVRAQPGPSTTALRPSRARNTMKSSTHPPFLRPCFHSASSPHRRLLEMQDAVLQHRVRRSSSSSSSSSSSVSIQTHSDLRRRR